MIFRREDSVLISRHLDLGAQIKDWNGMSTVDFYGSKACDEHDACREKATLTDVSGLKKVWVKGPDAVSAINHAITRDIAKCKDGSCVYTLLLTNQGTICDDAIVYKFSEERFLIAHGTGNAMECLEASAEGKNVSLTFDDNIQDISLQGPYSVEVLKPHTPMDIGTLKYFTQVETTLFGYEVMISRTGYTGERGYEIYAQREVMADIWDKILEAGQDKGILPASFTTLDKVRVEYGLLFYPDDMNENTSPWEVNLGWAVNTQKADYRGKEAVLALKGQEKVKLVGLVCDLTDSADGGEKLYLDDKEVGVITSVAWSHRLNKSLAFALVDAECAAIGTQLEARGEIAPNSYGVTVNEPSFYDPKKEIARAS